MRSSIMIVEDKKDNIDVLVGLLGHKHDLIVIKDGKNTMNVLKTTKPDVILLDIMMPDINGFDIIKQIKLNRRTKDIPVIFMSALSDIENKKLGFSIGAADYIIKPFDPVETELRIETQIELVSSRNKLKDYNKILEKKVKERTSEIAKTQEATIMSLASLAEYRDPETGGHLERVKRYVLLISETLRAKKFRTDFLTPYNIELLTASSSLHDIGKVAVPDHILLKPGPLTPEEFNQIKKHTVYGRDALLSAEKKLGTKSFLSFAQEVAYSHHEKWDGSGYPQGLQGNAIPLSGRIMAIADVYDVLISKRVYKKPINHYKAIEIIASEREKHFDPFLTDVFSSLTEDFRQIALAHCESEEERAALFK